MQYLKQITADFLQTYVTDTLWDRDKRFTFGRQKIKATVESNSGPALGMFEVFGRTGPQNLGGRNFAP